MKHRFAASALLILLLLALPTPAAETIAGFKLERERWTYTDGQTSIDGILVKPAGDGPFPAVLVSHGLGGGAEAFGLPKAREFVPMGMVCIAPNYTHARRAASFDGDRADFGASEVNLKRASLCLDILERLPYVDKTRIAAYGHSMGAFLTIALAAKEPKRIKASVITAGGVAPKAGFAAPTDETARGIRTPFLIFHGDADQVVRPEQSARLKEILDENKVPNERRLFEGAGHGIDRDKAKEIFPAIRAWLGKNDVLKP